MNIDTRTQRPVLVGIGDRWAVMDPATGLYHASALRPSEVALFHYADTAQAFLDLADSSSRWLPLR